jgi:hypothetical protein
MCVGRSPFLEIACIGVGSFFEIGLVSGAKALAK